MSFVLTLLLIFQANIDRVFTSIRNGEWLAAASALDEAYSADSVTFDANNFHYLRGRVAEAQRDWPRARDEFKSIEADNPLRPLALWHAAIVSAKLKDNTSAEEFISQLPADFPAELKTQVAREADPSLASKIYQSLVTREARYERAKSTQDTNALWSLIREFKDDDVALAAARLVGAQIANPKDQMDAAAVFVSHRQFAEALPLYQSSPENPDARYQIARIHFQQENYLLAIDDYRVIIADFAGTDWQKEAEYQIASCYWRLGDYRNSEKAYVDYIKKYGDKGMKEAATRNLVDVYRALGENQKALTTLDRALASRLSASTRQVLLFTKAKVLYTEKKYTAALALFQQLGRTKLRSAPGAATAEEIQYFQALCQSKLGNKTAANTIWRKLARAEFSYYGLRSAEKLGQVSAKRSASPCTAGSTTGLKSIELDLANLRHPVRTQMDSTADPVSELIFLQQWDEAAFWMDRTNTRPPRRAAAEIAYFGGQYDRAISLADRLPRTELTLPLIYPAGYRQTICDAAGTYKIDPLWLHAIIWQESKYNPDARSGAAARGLMQFIPETAQAMAAKIGMPQLSVEKLYDPEVSIQLGAVYWSTLLQELATPEMALAAYNGGPDNVQRWIAKSTDPELFVSDIGFVETKKYVMAVFAARAAYSSLF